MGTRYLVFDYETRSAADLKKVGAYEYSVHPSTKILCAAWRLGTKEELRSAPTRVWSPAFPAENGELGELVRSLLDPSIKIVAHNAFFEQVITKNVFARLMSSKPGLREIPHSRFICTAARAAALALPRKLEGACNVLGLPVQKDMEGAKLMLKYAKPRRPSKTNPSRWWKSKADLRRIMQYCATDVGAEVELFLSTPPLNPLEKKVWELDQEMNMGGIRVDRPLVDSVLKMVDEEIHNLNALTREMTRGELSSTTQRDKLLAYIRSRGGMLPDLRSKTVEDALAARLLDAHCETLLRARQAVSKTSTAKYAVFKRRSKFDGRVRDLLMYWGASTGRWAGTGLQPHNFPRGKIKITEAIVSAILGGDVEEIRLLYGDPMEVFSSALRGALIPSEGCELFAGDYATIEARVLFWMAGNTRGLEDFRNGVDSYRKMAGLIYTRHPDQIAKDSVERQVGKGAFLGNGFGQGWKTFKKTTFDQTRIRLTDEVAKKAVDTYRREHSQVPRMWKNIEKAAIAAVQNPGKVYAVNRTKWFLKDRFLWCELPSGRRLAYFGPTIRFRLTPWGKKVPTLYHWSVHPKTRKWVNDGTYGGKLTENVVQGCARDVMAEALLRIKVQRWRPLLSVHDEGVAERKTGERTAEDFAAVMAENPDWAVGLPIKVEAWKGPRYKK